MAFDEYQVWEDEEGRPHRDGDLPAVIRSDGTQYWYQHGKLHRDGDLPAIVCDGGYQTWYKHGKRHRDGDLPAVVLDSGYQEWHVHGVRQSDADRAATRRWSPLRAAFVGAVAVCAALCPPRPRVVFAATQ